MSTVDCRSIRGEKHIYVLDARIVVHIQFYTPITLNPGESI